MGTIYETMPILVSNEGVWEGWYRYYDAKTGALTDQHRSRLLCRLIDEGDGKVRYHQTNYYFWEDGRSEIRDFPAWYEDTGPVINPSEHFTIFTPAAAIDDRSVVSARYHAGFTRQGPWWPWMKMGQSGVQGVLMGRMHSYKITGGPEDVPKAVLKRVERDRPDLLDEPTDGPDEGVQDTFMRYAEEVAPEAPGYVRPKRP